VAEAVKYSSSTQIRLCCHSQSVVIGARTGTSAESSGDYPAVVGITMTTALADRRRPLKSVSTALVPELSARPNPKASTELSTVTVTVRTPTAIRRAVRRYPL
jgi:hypothetical protein